jgi:hypothetical protein
MVETITVNKEVFGKVMVDIGNLLEDFEILTNETVKKRLKEIKENPSIGKSERDLDEYLKKRGVQIGS